ncbi:glycosyl hydrolase family 18 protein [Patescibacteria group bacterium]
METANKESTTNSGTQANEAKSELQKDGENKSFFLKKLNIFFAFLFIFLNVFAIYYFENNIKKPVFLSPFIADLGTTLSSATESGKPKKIIGFLPSWQIAKKVVVYPDNLDELIFFDLEVDENGNLKKYDDDGYGLAGWTYLESDYFSSLAEESKAKGVNLVLALTCFDNETIDKIISNSVSTQNLINQLKPLIAKYEFTGINIDFEYIPVTDFPTRKYFTKFLETVSKAFKQDNPGFIISVDVYANSVLHDQPYDIAALGKHADEIIVMGYDFYRTTSTTAGPVAPLRSEKSDKNITETLKVIYSKVEREKIILGVPFYGYEWQTATEEYKSPTYPGSGALATIKRVKELLEDTKVEKFWDRITMTPYLVYKSAGTIKQIYYEDESSLALKNQLVNQLEIGGIAIWALGYEGDNPKLWEVFEH